MKQIIKNIKNYLLIAGVIMLAPISVHAHPKGPNPSDNPPHINIPSSSSNPRISIAHFFIPLWTHTVSEEGFHRFEGTFLNEQIIIEQIPQTSPANFSFTSGPICRSLLSSIINQTPSEFESQLSPNDRLEFSMNLIIVFRTLHTLNIM